MHVALCNASEKKISPQLVILNSCENEKLSGIYRWMSRHWQEYQRSTLLRDMWGFISQLVPPHSRVLTKLIAGRWSLINERDGRTHSWDGHQRKNTNFIATLPLVKWWYKNVQPVIFLWIVSIAPRQTRDVLFWLFYRKDGEVLERISAVKKERDEALLNCEKYQKLYDDLQERIAPFKVFLSVYVKYIWVEIIPI